VTRNKVLTWFLGGFRAGFSKDANDKGAFG